MSMNKEFQVGRRQKFTERLFHGNEVALSCHSISNANKHYHHASHLYHASHFVRFQPLLSSLVQPLLSSRPTPTLQSRPTPTLQFHPYSPVLIDSNPLLTL